MVASPFPHTNETASLFIKNEKSRTGLSKIPIIISIFIFGMITLSNYGFNTTEVLSTSLIVKDTSKLPRDSNNQINSLIDIEFENDYGVTTTAQSKYQWLNGKYLIEPFRVTTLRMKNIPESKSDYTFHWKLDDVVYKGSNVDVVFNKVGNFKVQIFEQKPGTEELNMIIERDIASKYVRREVRSLSSEDLTLLLDTMQTLYYLSTEEGKLLYGDDYLDAVYFSSLHNSLAGTHECDHLHQGLGFLTNHAALTLLYEKSLRSINPSISLPYWDYTIEGHSVWSSPTGDVSVWFSSPIFDTDIFGEGAPVEKYFTQGRWAYLPIVTNATTICSITNAYGMLRSPWNQNNIPYVTRHNHSFGYTLSPEDIPTCKSHYDQLKKDSWTTFGSSIEGKPHGSVHILLGGNWNANWKEIFDNMSFSSLGSEVTSFSFAHGWRKDVITCPTYCSMETSIQDCKCTCTEIEKWLSAGEGVVHAKLKKIAPSFFSNNNFYNDNGLDVSSELLKLFCNYYDDLTPFVGEMLTSPSPIDPLFWPTHPTLDRLWHWWRINDLGTYNWYYDSSACSGHNPNDTLPFSNLFDNVTGFYTNEQMYQLLDPDQDFIPYVYDNFEWDHCVSEGYAIDLLPNSNSDSNDNL